jgi:hypothetical protein
MSTVSARPLGSREPPEIVYVATPVFCYAIAAASAPFAEPRLRISPRGADPVFLSPKRVNGYLLFEVEDLRDGERYDGALVEGTGAVPLFRDAELYRLAVGDEAYRVLPEPDAEDAVRDEW